MARDIPAIIRLQESSRAQLVPFLEYGLILHMICAQNAIESINAGYS